MSEPPSEAEAKVYVTTIELYDRWEDATIRREVMVTVWPDGTAELATRYPEGDHNLATESRTWGPPVPLVKGHGQT